MEETEQQLCRQCSFPFAGPIPKKGSAQAAGKTYTLDGFPRSSLPLKHNVPILEGTRKTALIELSGRANPLSA